MTEKKTTKARIYIVTDLASATQPKTPVRARNADIALNFATRGRFSVRPATVEDYVRPDDVQDATVPGVHPDQKPLPLRDDNPHHGHADD